MFRLIIFFSSILLVTAKLPINIPRIENVQPLADDIVSYRLPNNTRPLTYDLSLETWIHTGNFTFTGTVRIDLLIVEPTTVITIHHRQLNILAVQFLFLQTLVPLPYEYDNVTEFLTINLPVQLNQDSVHTIIIDYVGTLRNDDAGFYRSSYLNDAGQTVYLATTQFESTDARHGLPCYDEPALKANFTIRITHDSSYTAISNMPERSSLPNGDGTVTTEFEPTPPTSSYLIAFIISDFSYLSNSENVGQFPHRVFARPNAIDLTYLTLDSGIAILAALEDYLGVDYSLPKMDQAAIPDFAAGAMENWGLVTYRESAFFWDDDTSAYTTKLSIVRIIAHEFTHQWFGNLVSPTWWTYLWLNEGFAALYGNYAIDLIYPEWNIKEQFVYGTLQNVLVSDASGSSRPMSYYIESPEAISRIFDNIAYDKSACVLRTFLNALSDATFVKGLNYYLNDRAYSDATEEDLFAGIERAAKEDGALSEDLYFPTIMRSWTQQSGFPIVYVQRHYDEGSMTISQEQFLTYPTSSLSSTTFWIPINFATAQNPDFSTTTADYWLPQNTRFIRIEQNPNNEWSENDWIVFNKQQGGYYRVQYDRRNWNLIAQALYENYDQIHLLSRSQLIDDSCTFARTNRLGWDIAFNILRYLENEIEYVPWASATRHLNYLNRFITGLDNYPLYRSFISRSTENLLENVGFEDIEDEPILRKYARTLIIDLSCTYGSEMCRQSANTYLREITADGTAIHQNLRNVLYCAGLRNANDLDYYNFWNRAITNPNDRSTILNALGCMSNENYLVDYLQQSLNESNSQSIRQAIFNSVYQNSPEGYVLATQFLIDNFESAAVIFNSNSNIGNAISGIAQRASHHQDITRVETLIESANSNGALSSYIYNANNYIFQNVQWLINNGYSIDQWLELNVAQ